MKHPVPNKKEHWYQLSIEDVMSELDTSISGLLDSQVSERRSTYGQNVLPGRRRLTLLQIVVNQFLNPLIYILLIAAIASIIFKEYTDAGFIFLVLTINAFIGAYQEWKAESKASALEHMIKLKARVKRDKKVQTLNSEDLVPGDIVMLESGNKVPADIRIIKDNNLAVIEAILTGESIAVNKNRNVITEDNPPISEQRNMLFAGTTVTTGRATGVVVTTGYSTEIGKIASSLRELETGKTPLVHRMEVFTRRISLIILVACLIIGAVGYMSGIPLMEMFFFIVAIAVSAIPEGLPIAMTVALSIGASRMARRNVIIRKLTAVEGLGSCTFIATDKTGTLTVDQQTVRAIVLPDLNSYKVTGEGYNGTGYLYDNDGSKLTFNAKPELEKIIRSVTICNEGDLTKENESWSYAGDPIDVALLALSYKTNSTPTTILEQVEKVSEVPFESERQYAAVYYRRDNETSLRISVKGAIEKIKEHIDEQQYTAILEKATEYAENGYRIIAVAEGIVDHVEPIGTLPPLELIGFIALIDPLRPEAKEAVEKSHKAGVEVAMITGDHPSTSLAIAKEVGIALDKGQLITGKELDEIGTEHPDELLNVLKTKRVFSRVSPHQKQLIVEALRKSGHFIAVTGDGVNDAPALKSANIGVSMGYGTDVAKDNSSIIINDNNFSSIVAGIEEGRFTYGNLRKIIYLLISTGLAELIVIGLSLAFSLPLPFLPVQLLWLNLVTNGIQDVALAFEAGEKALMNDRPRDPKESIFNKLMIGQTVMASVTISMLAFGLWYHLLNNLHWEESTARNTILLLMVLLQNFHALNCRSERRSVFSIPLKNNLTLVLGIFAAQGIHILAMHTPLMQDILSISPVPWNNWLNLFFTASIIVLAMEVFKVSFNRLSIINKRSKQNR